MLQIAQFIHFDEFVGDVSRSERRFCPCSCGGNWDCLAAVFMLGPRGMSSLASLAFAAWSSFSPPVLCTVFVWPFWLLLQALWNVEHLCTVVITVSFQKLHSMGSCMFVCFTFIVSIAGKELVSQSSNVLYADVNWSFEEVCPSKATSWVLIWMTWALAKT